MQLEVDLINLLLLVDNITLLADNLLVEFTKQVRLGVVRLTKLVQDDQIL